MKQKVLVWGTVSTIDYYGEYEAVVTSVKKMSKVGRYSIAGEVKGTRTEVHESSKAASLWKAAVVLPVADGEKVQVRWSAKRTTLETLSVIDGHGSAQIDMNNCPDHFPTRRLVIKTKYEGVETKVPLKGKQIGVLL